MKVLYLIRGAQGSGKSTLAKAMVKSGLVERHLETDMYFMDGGKYKWDGKRVGHAHEWCQMSCEDYLVKGENVVVSNTFTSRKHTKPYHDMAAKHGFIVQEIVLMRPVFKNEHGCGPELVKKFHDRLMADIAGREMEDIHC